MVRISGLASGMDIDQMVKDLMKVERMPLDKLKQKQQTLEWQRDDYRALNTLFFNFRSTLTNMKLTPSYRVRSTVSTNESLLSATASSGAGLSSYSISKVKQLATAATKVNMGSISADTKQNKINVNESLSKQKFGTDISWEKGSVEYKTISVTEDKKDFSLDLQNVKLKLDKQNVPDTTAINVKVNGISYEVITDSSIPLQSNQVLVKENGELTFADNIKKGSNIQVDYVTDFKNEKITLSEDTTGWQLSKGEIQEFTLKVGSDIYKISDGDLLKDGTGEKIGSIDKETGKITFDSTFISNNVDKEIEVEYNQNYTTFNIQTSTSKGKMNQNFLIQSTDSLNSMMNKVNNSNVGVSMFYDSFTDKMTLTRTETGNFNGDSKNKLDSNGNLIENSNYDPQKDQEIFTSGDFIQNVLKFDGATETGGENAIFEINGLQTERTSNTFEMNGVTFTLKKTFEDPESVSISNDSSKVFDNIKAFVDEYNKLIDTVNKKITEDRYRDYGPLTDEQREQLSDKQQEKWEEMAKSGLLKGDSILSGALSQMRLSMYTPVDNENISPAMKQLAAIGIKTTANYLDGGKLEIDEAKLKKAIEEDPASVENLFRGTGDSTSSKGIVQRLYDDVSGTIDKLNERAGKATYTNQQFTIGKNLDDVSKKITTFTDRLKQIEDRYYNQFTAMEQAIQKANSQMSYLMQYFGGGQ
ncbi:flagellar filament capping protein FliD [Heyndrickxia oleronia]|jgi:flagellar hook-associated protein 2|uniref:flagellar filament capping protein FliD n=1 Tax=Heyndrickxia oleronia TaxID=38875 RepID=UPI00242A73C6|nr:flagellar filament capping protein FliD [Heyndrickxia oleronia]MCI1592518.1 flagellar filament capping protein FliD [Heyndrickxia oleronia]MCI1615380.1 flagellar filament capping protein FliD [Heyndrickxia oleronia]MCI1746222.1 flagellar filament capping protein FliD [Heyndrickxia oleronia]MCI1763667.1 flagellar filament capping protein FliD [Heyndrickxia oleronia]